MKNRPETRRREIWSFFSGAFGLDLGFEQVGLKTSLAVEKDKWCCQTIRVNRPGLTVLNADIRQLSAKDLRTARSFSGDVFAVIGGPPCQSFCPGGKRAALSDPRGNLIYEFFRLVREVQPKFFVFENVANLVTAALRHRRIKDRPGKHWSLKKYSDTAIYDAADASGRLTEEELSGSAIRVLLHDIDTLGYSYRFGVLNAAHFGAPQNRLRFVMFGSRDGAAPPLPKATHGEGLGLAPMMTTKDAIWDLRRTPGASSEYTPRVRAFFERIPEGKNWRFLPIEVQKEALGIAAFSAGGGKTGFYRRLQWNSPSPTVTGRSNRKASSLCHPEQTRPLSVVECGRLQGFPDDWAFAGSMAQRYLQIGNAVPVALGKAVGHSLLKAAKMRATTQPSTPNVAEMLETAIHTLRQTARNRVKPSKQNGNQRV